MHTFAIFDDLPDDPLSAAELLCSEYHSNYSDSSSMPEIARIDFFYQFAKYSKTHNIDLNYPSLKAMTITEAATEVDVFLTSILLEIKEASVNRHVEMIKSASGLTKEEKQFIEQEISAIRGITNSSSTTSDDHKARLLSALNLLQQELDKPTGDYFVWIGKLGMHNSLAKEFVDTLQPVLDGVNKYTK